MSVDVSAIKTVSPVKTNETQTVRNRVDKIGQISQKEGIGFKKIKACFVCKSTDHLIKDCDFYDKKIPEPKLKTMVNTGVLTRKGLINPGRPNGKRAVHTVSIARLISTARPGNPKSVLQDHAVVDSGCSSHMTGNKAYLSDYEDYNGDFVAFGSDPKGGFLLKSIVLRAPRQNGVYSLDLKNIVPSGEFKNHAMNEFCAKKGIKREFSVARTPWQNGVAERKNRTLIEAARTMLADSLLPIPFWAEAVNTTCYVLNRVLVTKPQNKTSYELLIGKPPSISFMRLFGCPLTILNTLDPFGKFDGKSDEGYLLGYSTISKAFRVYNKRTKRVEENMHIDFLKIYICGRKWSWIQKMLLKKPLKKKEWAAHATSINKLNTGRTSVSTSNSPLVSIANTPYASAASTPTGVNTSGSSFVYLGGQIPIDAHTLPNVDLPIDPNMLDLEDNSNNDIHKPERMKVGLKQCKRIAPVQNYRRYWLLVDFPFGKGNGTQSRSSGIRWMEEYIVNKQSQACSTRGLERGWYRLLMRFLLLLPGLRPIQVKQQPMESLVGQTRYFTQIQELVASIDNNEYTITEASIRSQLQLADATGEHVPLLPAMLAGAAPDQGEGSAIPAGSQLTPDPGPTVTLVVDEATTTGVGVETEGATTKPSGLDAGMDSGNIHESPLRSHKASFHKGNTSRSAEDSLNLKELMDIIPKLVLRIDNLEKELQQTKSTYGEALWKIQDIDDDPLVSLVRNSMEEKEAYFVTPKKVSALGEAQEEDISPTTLEAAKTLSKVASQNVSTYKRRARSASKGKDIGIGMDFFSAAKERCNSAEVEVNTEVNPGSAGVNTGNTPVSTCNTPKNRS
ncbi:retrovirus-related pol polyprotein from transposon TNT 1-94 [Tanacetum coccineum]